ncbi:FUSC family protein [Polaromonas sp. SM01]|uniref:FUSC family protein n=1 Tax=Polaromonas sp. SM01 TaxID=3085630 RepID=UPI0029821E23|nr:FUSC family protein [Polaromonas sp. SM01]MDW5443120.1 FUSC family protein [Polaromonas sp. SM01]
MASTPSFAFLPRPDRVVVMRALRGTVAALLAFAVAALLQLDSPYWAAMTVWAVAQPTRGMLVGKALSRLAGTLVGALVSIPVLHLYAYSPLACVLVLALWGGACSLVANLLTGFRGYAAVLAGYTAPLVMVVAVHHPEQINDMAASRVACILVGIAASTLLTWLWTPDGDLGLLRQRVERTAGEANRWMAALLSANASQKNTTALASRVMSDMAVIDGQCDQGDSGAASVRQERRHVRHLLASLLNAMALAQALADALATAGAQTAATSCLRARLQVTEPSAQALLQALDDWLAAQGHLPDELKKCLLDWRAALIAVVADLQRPESPASHALARQGPSLVAVRNWPDALRSGVRTLLVVAVLGGAWVGTGWPLFLMAMMGASMLSSIFATFEAPQTSIIRAVKGTAMGTVAALLCGLLLLTHVHTLPTLLLVLAPFIYLGALLLNDRRTVGLGMDYSMVFLLITAPSLPVAMSSEHFLRVAPGPLIGAVMAAAALHLLLPTGPRRRLHDVMQGIIRDLHQLAVSRQPPSEGFWRARLAPGLASGIADFLGGLRQASGRRRRSDFVESGRRLAGPARRTGAAACSGSGGGCRAGLAGRAG